MFLEVNIVHLCCFLRIDLEYELNDDMFIAYEWGNDWGQYAVKK